MSEQFTLFYGGIFSQWFRSPFDIDETTYNTAEQWMMACKARHFSDEKALARIMKAGHPAEQKKLGRTVVGFTVAEWNQVARDYVYKGNYAKFSQDQQLRQNLLKTKGTTLVEASPQDRLWGIGLGLDDPDALDRSKWRGVNWLGEVLTRVRDDMIAHRKTTEDFGWSGAVHVYKEPPKI